MDPLLGRTVQNFIEIFIFPCCSRLMQEFWSQIESQESVSILESLDTEVKSSGRYAGLLVQLGEGSHHVAHSEVGFDFEQLIIKLDLGLPYVELLEV